MEGSSNPSFFPFNAKAAAEDYSSSESEYDEPTVPGLDGDDNDFGDFNPRKKRRVGGNNKEKAALGIFGSDSEDDNPNSRWKRKTLRRKGVNFVSTAAEGAEQDEDDESEDERPRLGIGLNAHGRDGEEDEDGDEDDEDDDDRPAGLGLGNAAMKLRFTAGEKSREENPQKATTTRPLFKTNFSSGGVLGGGFVPSSARDPVLKETNDGNETPRNKPQVSAFGSKGKINSKSFGARMMAKMGYQEGKGLGKEGEGRNIIIEANLRPQGVGLGAVKEKTEQERQEEKRQARLRGEEVVDSEEEEKKRRKAKKKAKGAISYSSAGSTPMRQRTKYLTADELKKRAPGLNIPEAFAPILDMTGPGGRLLTSSSGIMTPSSGVPESNEVIEARKLAKRAQSDLLAFTEEWKSLESRKTWVNLELKQREQEMEDLRSDFERLQTFANVVTERLVEATEWEQVMSALQTAVDAGSANDAIADIAVAAIHPFLRSPDWDPMAEPSRFAPDLQKLSGLLIRPANSNQSVNKWNSSASQDDGVYRTHHKATTPYETMMYKNWLPRVLTALRSWDPLNPTPMLSIMENWNDLLPPFVRAQLVDNVARKLETAVSDWNPKKKRQSHHLPHTWLFPWLQYLPHYHLDPRGTGLVADVRRKFRHLIDAWEFERGVVPGLAQWKDVLGDQWRPLIMSHVLPSMGKYLRTNFRVDPAEQEPYLPILVGIMKWNQVLGDTVLAEVLVQDMFPMWSSRLQEWLALDEADLGEVADWYSWWRGVLLKDMAQIKAVRVELDRGLQLVNMI
ncbi:G-patch domain-containing protein [Trichoderma simmonsii]|uniref:G-patch domain-containing protein n=1 Tax=Trichoderma simmonsii TaxID=1491479 RepID=A0A8G0LHC4_9HYPO|nr:G-patch domain-containing protein [Trichoderma simmonsii]